MAPERQHQIRIKFASGLHQENWSEVVDCFCKRYMYGMCMYMCLAGGSKLGDMGSVGKAKAGVPDWTARTI